MNQTLSLSLATKSKGRKLHQRNRKVELQQLAKISSVKSTGCRQLFRQYRSQRKFWKQPPCMGLMRDELRTMTRLQSQKRWQVPQLLSKGRRRIPLTVVKKLLQCQSLEAFKKVRRCEDLKIHHEAKDQHNVKVHSNRRAKPMGGLIHKQNSMYFNLLSIRIFWEKRIGLEISLINWNKKESLQSKMSSTWQKLSQRSNKLISVLEKMYFSLRCSTRTLKKIERKSRANQNQFSKKVSC